MEDEREELLKLQEELKDVQIGGWPDIDGNNINHLRELKRMIDFVKKHK